MGCGGWGWGEKMSRAKKTNTYLLSSCGFSVKYGLGCLVVSCDHGCSKGSVASVILKLEVEVGVRKQQGDDHWVLVFYGQVNWCLPLCILMQNEKSKTLSQLTFRAGKKTTLFNLLQNLP